MESVSYKLVRFAALGQGWESAVGFFVDMSVDLHRAFPHGVARGLWRLRGLGCFPHGVPGGTMGIEVVQVVSLVEL